MENEIAQALLPFAQAYHRCTYYQSPFNPEATLNIYQGNTSFELFADGLKEDQLLTLKHLQKAYDVCSKAGLL